MCDIVSVLTTLTLRQEKKKVNETWSKEYTLSFTESLLSNLYALIKSMRGEMQVTSKGALLAPGENKSVLPCLLHFWRSPAFLCSRPHPASTKPAGEYHLENPLLSLLSHLL